MDLVNSILSNLICDLLKEKVKLTYQDIFGNFYGKEMKSNNIIYTNFLVMINEKNGTIEKEKTIEKLLQSEETTAIFERELYNTDFAKRLDYIICLINQKESLGEKINIDYLGEWLGFKSVNELKKYYLYDAEPDYDFIDNIADRLGINKKWLKHGVNAEPFQSMLPRIYDTKELLYYNRDAQFVFAIKDCDDRQEILVIKRTNELKYEVFPRPIVFHSKIGATGEYELYSTYCFLKQLSSNGSTDLFSVHFVPEKIFYNLIAGKCYPGIVINYSAQHKSNILSDFLDIDHRYSVDNYVGWYGEDFVKKQKLVKNYICRNFK